MLTASCGPALIHGADWARSDSAEQMKPPKAAAAGGEKEPKDGAGCNRAVCAGDAAVVATGERGVGPGEATFAYIGDAADCAAAIRAVCAGEATRAVRDPCDTGAVWWEGRAVGIGDKTLADRIANGVRNGTFACEGTDQLLGVCGGAGDADVVIFFCSTCCTNIEICPFAS